ncbi:MAG: DUF3658 domain-containing protein [Oscillospiraceae bacterium]
MINLCFSDSAAGTLIHRRNEVGVERSTLHWVKLDLHGGDISLPFDIENRRSYLDTMLYKRYADEIAKHISDFDDALKKCDELYIWYCRTDIDEYLGMMWAVYRAKDFTKNIFLCDCTDNGPGIIILSETKNIICRKKKLTANDIEEISEYWEKLCSENTGLRILENDKPVSKPENYFDEQIFEIAGNSIVDVFYILKIMLCREESRYMMSFLVNRIEKLVKQKEFVVVQKGYFERWKSFQYSIIRRNKHIDDCSEPEIKLNGKLKKIIIKSFNYLTAVPKEEDDIIQNLTITSSGRISFGEYKREVTIENYRLKETKTKIRSIHTQIGKAKTEKIFDCFQKCFSERYILHKVNRYGFWKLELTSDSGEKHTIEGPLIQEFISECCDLSDVVRNNLNIDGLLLFDWNKELFDSQKAIRVRM